VIWDYVHEEYVDYDEIYRRGGQNLGDEDFALFRCPACDRVYLVDYEVDTVYLDGRDLSRRIDVDGEPFYCTGCRERIPDDKAWVGQNPSPRFRVSWALLASSDWAWVAKRA
jgi:hypothetical protein